MTKKARPDWCIEVLEQNRPDDTFGFGVVFSDSSLDEYESRDSIIYERMRAEFAYWDDIDIHFKGEYMKCRGNGFCGTSRVHLLSILHDRCRELGVDLHFETRVDAASLEEQFADSDLVCRIDRGPEKADSDRLYFQFRQAAHHAL